MVRQARGAGCIDRSIANSPWSTVHRTNRPHISGPHHFDRQGQEAAAFCTPHMPCGVRSGPVRVLTCGAPVVRSRDWDPGNTGPALAPMPRPHRSFHSASPPSRCAFPAFPCDLTTGRGNRDGLCLCATAQGISFFLSSSHTP